VAEPSRQAATPKLCLRKLRDTPAFQQERHMLKLGTRSFGLLPVLRKPPQLGMDGLSLVHIAAERQRSRVPAVTIDPFAKRGRGQARFAAASKEVSISHEAILQIKGSYASERVAPKKARI
jgi:hypothetical protein